MNAPPPRAAPKAAPKLSQNDLMQVLNQLGGDDDRAKRSEDGATGGGLSAAEILGGAPAPKPTAPQRRPSANPAPPADQANAIRTLAAVYARNRKRP